MTKKQRKIFYAIIFILGISLMIWQIKIYRNTIIDLPILIGIILATGIVAFIVDYKNYGRTYDYEGVEYPISSTKGYKYSIPLDLRKQCNSYNKKII